MDSKPLLLITGGSRGIGASLAKLACKNYDIAINYHSNKQAAKEVQKYILNQGGNVQIYPADISDEYQVKQMLEKIDKNFARLDYLVNNAAILFENASFMQINNQRFKKTFATNIYGVINCSRYAIDLMLKNKNQQDRAIVNISSGAAKWGAANIYIDYAMSKGAIESFTKGLAIELAPYKIRVNGIRPGIIDTDIHQNKEQRLAKAAKTIPLGRIGTTDEVAHSILHLLSVNSSYITGTFLEVRGGLA